MSPAAEELRPPYTQAVRRALEESKDPRQAEDLLFLEAWEIRPSANLGVTLRASQIRRANPGLAAEIDAELKAQAGKPAKLRQVLAALD
jgi:hypothetical protein